MRPGPTPRPARAVRVPAQLDATTHARLADARAQARRQGKGRAWEQAYEALRRYHGVLDAVQGANRTTGLGG